MAQVASLLSVCSKVIEAEPHDIDPPLMQLRMMVESAKISEYDRPILKTGAQGCVVCVAGVVRSALSLWVVVGWVVVLLTSAMLMASFRTPLLFIPSQPPLSVSLADMEVLAQHLTMIDHSYYVNVKPTEVREVDV